ncbi:MAG TPA: sugar phosphate isomerase/epimerase [Nitrospirota bacterium]|nr:sugar phosphate isomerase/epimerase [Nitrospirota bacterium]
MHVIGSKIDEVRIDGDLEKFRYDLESFARFGIKATELPVHGFDAIKKGRLDDRQTGRLLKALRNYDFLFSVHAPNPLNLMDKTHHALHVAVLRSSLEFSRAVGSRILVYHPGRFFAEETFPIIGKGHISDTAKKKMMTDEAAALSMLADEFPDIVICLENARPYLYHSPYCYAEKIGLLREQVIRINKNNVKINLDVGHLYMSSIFYNFDAIQATREIAGLIAHTHVHDNFGNAVYAHEKQQTHQIPFGRGDSHLPVGWGEIPIAKILETFINNYDGMLMMELRSRYFMYTEESKDNLSQLCNSIQKQSSTMI